MCRNKYLLLNSQELNELSAISMKANIPEVEALVNTDRSLVCDGKKGLLTRILTVMKREPPDSSFRSGPRESDRQCRLWGFGESLRACERFHSIPIQRELNQFITKTCDILQNPALSVDTNPGILGHNVLPAGDMVPHVGGFPIIFTCSLAELANIVTFDTFLFLLNLKMLPNADLKS